MITLRNIPLISIFGGFAVIGGAFGSHILKAKLSPEYLGVWHTGIEYQFYHVFAIGLVSILPKVEKWYKRPERWFSWGIVFFSGSLYMLAIISLYPIPLKWLGLLTPIGGVFFIMGWMSLLLKRKASE